MTPDAVRPMAAAAASVGKRLSTADPLGPHDVADRLDRAAVRAWRIILLAEEMGPDFAGQVRTSRYLTNALTELRDAIDRLMATPSPWRDDAEGPPTCPG